MHPEDIFPPILSPKIKYAAPSDTDLSINDKNTLLAEFDIDSGLGVFFWSFISEQTFFRGSFIIYFADSFISLFAIALLSLLSFFLSF